MDIYLGDTSLTYKVIGGVIDLYLFAGSSPAAVVSQLTSVIGRPSMVPYWSLGFRKRCSFVLTLFLPVHETFSYLFMRHFPTCS